jgi:N-acetylmuramoyl-L-alanine amidase
MHFFGRFLILVLAPLLLCQAAWAKPAILDIRLGQHPGSTRIVVELSEATAYRVGLLAGPPRLYIELPESDWQGPRLPRVVGQVKSLAMASPGNGLTRLTANLRGNATIGSVMMIAGSSGPNTRRLVIDLAPASAGDFANAVLGTPVDSTPPLVVVSMAANPPPVASAAAVPAPPVPASVTGPATVSNNIAPDAPLLRPVSEIVMFPANSSGPASGSPSSGTAGSAPAFIGAQPATAIVVASATDTAGTSNSPPGNSGGSSSALGQSVAIMALPPGVPKLRPEPVGLPLVYIDPGHGGPDPGTIGHSGSYEKNVTLAVARELERELLATGRYRVKLTRESDVFVALRERFEMARIDHADIFISLHADSSFVGDPRGLSVYTLSETSSDAEAAALAAKENKADLIAGVDLTKQSTAVTSILIDLAQRETKNQSAHFAELLVNELARVTMLLPNTHRFAGFAVLKAPDIASVLIEMGYLSNVQDEALLLSAAHRAKLAGAMLRAIDGYFAVTVASGKS